MAITEGKEGKRTNEKSLKFYARVDQVVHLILTNPRYLKLKRAPELTQLVREHIKKENKAEISIRQAHRYVNEAKKVIREYAKADGKKNLEQAVYSRISLIERARGSKDLKTELATLKDIAELQGLYPDKNINLKGSVTLKNIDLSKMTKDQLRRIANAQTELEILQIANELGTDKKES